MCDDEKFMHRALELAGEAWGLTTPNPMVGAVIVRDGRIIGEGFHRRCGMPHAEVEAMLDAARRREDIHGATIYVTLEPCSTFGRTPPCTKGIIDAGLARVVIGTLDPNPAHAGRGVDVLQQAGIEVTSGVAEPECRRINAPFFKWITTRKPFVILKMAMTLDGKIATASGSSQWITGEAARAGVQKLRRLADGIMVGGETVRMDKPRLNVRIPENWEKQPRRFVATEKMTADELALLMPGKTAPECVTVGGAGEWDALLTRLGEEEIVTLLIEGGGELAASALNAGIVDFVEFHIAPKILGGRRSRPVVGGADPESLAEAMELDEVKVEFLGRDIAVSGFCRKGKK